MTRVLLRVPARRQRHEPAHPDHGGPGAAWPDRGDGIAVRRASPTPCPRPRPHRHRHHLRRLGVPARADLPLVAAQLADEADDAIERRARRRHRGGDGGGARPRPSLDDAAEAAVHDESDAHGDEPKTPERAHMNALVPLVVLIPLVGAAGLIARRPPPPPGDHRSPPCRSSSSARPARRRRPERRDRREIGGWPAPFGIVLVVDRLAALMLLVSSIVLLAVFVFSVGQGNADGDARHRSRSTTRPTSSSRRRVQRVHRGRPVQPLRRLRDPARGELRADHPRRHRARIRAGITYIVVSLVSSMLFLASIAMIYGALGTVNIAHRR